MSFHGLLLVLWFLGCSQCTQYRHHHLHLAEKEILGFEKCRAVIEYSRFGWLVDTKELDSSVALLVVQKLKFDKLINGNVVW